MQNPHFNLFTTIINLKDFFFCIAATTERKHLQPPLNSHTTKHKENESGSSVRTSQYLLEYEKEKMLKA